MIEPLNADALIDTAMALVGLDDFGGDSYREGLDVLVRDYNAGLAKGWMNLNGRDMTARDCDPLSVAPTAGNRPPQAEPGSDRRQGRTSGFRHGNPAHRNDAALESAGLRSGAALAAVVGNRRAGPACRTRHDHDRSARSGPAAAGGGNAQGHARCLQILSRLGDLPQRVRVFPRARFQDADDRIEGPPARISRVRLQLLDGIGLCLSPQVPPASPGQQPRRVEPQDAKPHAASR